MRILQIIDSLATGGSERMAVNIANAFSERGVSNAICATRTGGQMQAFLDQSIPVYILNKKGTADAVAFKKFLQVISDYKPSIIHAHSSSFFWAVLAKMVYKNIVIIWHDHYGLSETLRPSDRPLLRMLSKKLNGIIAVNEILKQWNCLHTNVPENYIRCLNNFPDISLYQLKQKKADEITIVCLANFKPEKDQLTLIRAFDLVQKKFRERKLKLILAGKKTGQDYYNKVVELIYSFGLQKKIILAGVVENTVSLLSEADVGVLSSYSEGLPLSLLEYGLAELPVLVTNVGQCKEVVQHGRCGWVAEPENFKAFADRLIYILQHPEEAKEKAQLFKQRVLSLYGPQQFMDEYFSFVNTLLKERKRNALLVEE